MNVAVFPLLLTKVALPMSFESSKNSTEPVGAPLVEAVLVTVAVKVAVWP